MSRRITGTMTVVGVVSTTLLGFAAQASAHTPEVTATCVAETATLSVGLTGYNAKKPNRVVVTDNGKPLAEKTFGTEYEKDWNALDGKVEHTFVVTVEAWDDADGKEGWSFRKEVKLPKCVKTPPTTTTKTTVPSSSAPSSPVAPTTTTTTTAVPAPAKEASPPLAATGASPVLLVLSGLGLVGAGAGVLLFLRRKQA